MNSQNEQFSLAAIWQMDTQNQIFQSLMQAMSRPGIAVNFENILDDSDVPTAVLATLSDSQVKASNHDALVSDWDWSLSQCQNSTPEFADYIICDGSLPCAISPKLGSLSSPDHSATVILKVHDFIIAKPQYRLQGPGIDGPLNVGIQGLHQSWIQQRNEWNSQFPMGIDMILTAKTSALALPRTTQLEVLS